ncbi:hypothetical protein Sste5346_003941 [Sporothrix stenoceras]|uniref:Uncharacterized protein n=1 Tax=Sporothrix stenoceras TaxID=5173 RepID=A0ABR3ZBF7_9PEZI
MTSFHTYAQAAAVRAQHHHGASNPTRILLPVVVIIALLAAALLPSDESSDGYSPLLLLIRQTIIITAAAIGIPGSLCSIVLYHAGKRDELGYLCVPLGLASGTVAAAVTLAQNLPLESSPIVSSGGVRTH